MSVTTEVTGQEVLSPVPRTLREWREQVLNGLMRGVLAFGTLALITGILNAVRDNRPDLLVIYLVAYATLVAVTFVRRLGFVVRASVLLLLLYGLGAVGLWEAGLSGDGRVFLFAFVAVAAVLFDLRGSVGAIVLSLGTLTISAWLLVTGRWQIPLEIQANSTDPGSWLSGSVVFVLLSVAVIIPMAYLIRSLDRSLATSRSMVRELQEHQENLERLVQARTADLERRATQLQVAAEIARDAAAVRELDDLLNRAVNLVRERFGFYHAGIFLLDEAGEYAVLRAATGEAGRRMLEQGHKLKVGEVGIVGHVTGTGRPRVALDVGADAVHFKNPLLPDTRSEMALPLKVGGRIIGALDVQSTQHAAFDEDDVVILQTMADQLAVAIENARLLQEMRQALQEMEASYGRYTQEAWHAFVHSVRRLPGYRYQRLGVRPVTGQHPEAREALLQGRSVLTTVSPEQLESRAEEGHQPENGTVSLLAVPIKLRGQVIGVLDVHFEGETVPSETVSLVEEVAERLALAVENARLVQEAQRLALREQQINLISTRARSSVNLDTILQNTVRELGKALGSSRAFIQLGLTSEPVYEEGEG